MLVDGETDARSIVEISEAKKVISHKLPLLTYTLDKRIDGFL